MAQPVQIAFEAEVEVWLDATGFRADRKPDGGGPCGAPTATTKDPRLLPLAPNQPHRRRLVPAPLGCPTRITPMNRDRTRHRRPRIAAPGRHCGAIFATHCAATRSARRSTETPRPGA